MAVLVRFCLSPKALIYDKMKGMKHKKLLLTTGLAGLVGLTALGYGLQQKMADRKQARIVAEIRAYFSKMGDIQVLYIKDYETQDASLSGGLVFEDGRVLDFIYDDGHISYSEGQENA